MQFQETYNMIMELKFLSLFVRERACKCVYVQDGDVVLISEKTN